MTKEENDLAYAIASIRFHRQRRWIAELGKRLMEEEAKKNA